jgi:acyl-CoA synthetase (AMP-forming)/AMP-acid ligase II
MNAEDPLFILYTSGSTGKPKGVMHTSGGYLMYTAFTHQYVFDYHEGDVYWCTADVGWVTGHSYIVYGPLANGATTVMFEGVPNHPTSSRFWDVIDKHKVNIFYTAPTALRALMREGDGPVKKTSRKSLRLLGSVGEPINPEAWLWYWRTVGDSRCPIVDTWWQTETGGILISPLPGATDLKPGSATKPLFGVVPQLVDADGKVLEGAASGNLVLLDSWPGQMRSVYGDHQRFIDTYFKTYRGKYFTGDGCRRDEDGYYWIAGRPSRCGRSRRRRLSARHQGPGHLCVCDVEDRRRSDRCAEQGPGSMGRQGNRPHRETRCDSVRTGPAENPLRQDHAPHPAQDRGRRHITSWRYNNACRSVGCGRSGEKRGEEINGAIIKTSRSSLPPCRCRSA